MRHLLKLVLILLPAISCKAQFMEISDSNGFCLPHWKWVTNNKLCPDTLFNKDIVYLIGSIDNYIKIGTDTSCCRGHLLKSKYLIIENNFRKLEKVMERKNLIKFNYNNISVTIKTQRFKSRNYKIKYSDTEKVWIESIDGKVPMGNPTSPKDEYKSIKIEQNGKVLYLPDEQVKYLYEPNIEYTRVHYDDKNERIYIITSNSDGGETYHVLWLIEKGNFIKRIMKDGN